MHCYPNDTPERFQLDEVLDLLAEHAMSNMAKGMALDLKAADDAEIVGLRLQQTWEFYKVFEEGLSFPSVRFPEVRKAMATLELSNSVLEGEDMLAIRETVEVANQLIRYLHKHRDTFPGLHRLTENTEVCKPVVEEIDRVLEPPGIVKSNASKALADIRKNLTAMRQQANRMFLNEVRKYQKGGYLREFNESVWNDRRVLAVRAEFKRQIKGIFHGSSDSGQTAFIEPSALVSLNNEIAELEQDERREVIRILRELTAIVSGYLYQIKGAATLLANADLCRAKALLARDLKAAKPRINTEGKLLLKEARHPLLYLQNKKDDKRTVPLDLHMDRDQRILIISGPNAGGKSISLKTVGLLQLMLQCGMMVPVHPDSEMPLFKALLVDIGDDQSIEMELSTYSSRLVKMKYFLGYAGPDTFFYIDEFGTGSDPELGGVMAEAILEDIAASGAYGIVTTHYTNIKLLAERRSEMENACMLFDEATLSPLYKLVIGQPGSSYTFEVAKRIGLPSELLDAAREKVDGNRVHLESLLVKLQEDQQRLDKARKKLKTEQHQTEEKGKMYADLVQKLQAMEEAERARKKEVTALTDQGHKLQSLIDLYNEKGDRRTVVKKLMILLNNEKSKRDKAKKEALQQQQEAAKKEADQAKSKLERAKQKRKEALAKEKIEVGSKVKLKGSHEKGEVESISGTKATVVFGMMRTIAPLKQLQLVERKRKKKKKPPASK